MKTTTFFCIILTLMIMHLSVSSTGQGNNQAIFIQDGTFCCGDTNWYLPSSVYELYQNEFIIGETHPYGEYKVWVLNSEGETDYLQFNSSEDFDISAGKDSLVQVDLYTIGKEMGIEQATSTTDSLGQLGIWYLLQPNLQTEQQYEIEFSLFFENPMDTSGLSLYEKDTIYYVNYMKPYYSFLRSTYPEIDSANFLVMGLGYFELSVLLYLESDVFDFSLLENSGLILKKEPVIRPRRYRLIIFKPKKAASVQEWPLSRLLKEDSPFK